MRLLGGLTLIFAGSFAATVITFGWPENPSSRQGLLAHIPAMRLAASSAHH